MKHLLIIQWPDGTENKIALEGDKVTLGRSAGNSIQLHVPEVSSRHLEFIKTEGGYRAVDTDSANGTEVNGARIGECQLQDGDLLLIGEVLRVKYRVVEPPANPRIPRPANASPGVLGETAGVPAIRSRQPQIN